MIWKRFNISMAVLLCLLLCSPSYYINAEKETDNATTEALPTYESSQGVDTSFLKNDAKIPYIYSKSVVLMDAATGEILYQKNPTKKCHPASTTKCITSLLACEKGNMSDVLTFSDTAIFSIEPGSSNVALNVGEQLTLEQALYGMMLESGNEAANGIAEYVGGSLTDFAKLMTQTVKDLGGKKSNFENPNGLYTKNHYSCAYDMALVVREGLKNENWRKFTSTTYYELPPTNKQELTRYWYNHHKMLMNNPGYEYSGIEGGKTGYTTQSNYSLVSYAKRGDLELICICMNCATSPAIYADTKNLFNFGFDNFSVLKPEASLSSASLDNLDIIQSNYRLFFPTSLLDFSTNNDSTEGQLVVSNTADTSTITGNFKVDINYETNQLGVFEFTCDNQVVATSNVYFSASGLSSKYTGDPAVLRKIHIRNTIIITICILFGLLILLFILLAIAKKKNIDIKSKFRKSKAMEFSSDALPIAQKNAETLDSIITQDDIAVKQDAIRLEQEKRRQIQEQLRAEKLEMQKAKAAKLEAERKARLLAEEKEAAQKEALKQQRLKEMEQFKKAQEEQLLQQQMITDADDYIASEDEIIQKIEEKEAEKLRIYMEKQQQKEEAKRLKKKAKQLQKNGIAIVPDETKETPVEKEIEKEEIPRKKKKPSTAKIAKENIQAALAADTKESTTIKEANTTPPSSPSKKKEIPPIIEEKPITPTEKEEEAPVVREIKNRPKKKKFQYNVQATNLNGGTSVNTNASVPAHKQVSELANTANAIANAEKILSNISKGTLSGITPTSQEAQALTETIGSLMDAVSKASDAVEPVHSTPSADTPTNIEEPTSSHKPTNNNKAKNIKSTKNTENESHATLKKDAEQNTSSASNIDENTKNEAIQEKDTNVMNNTLPKSDENVHNLEKEPTESLQTIPPDEETKQALSNRKIFKPEVDVTAFAQSSITDKKASSVFSVFGKKKSDSDSDEIDMGYLKERKNRKK